MTQVPLTFWTEISGVEAPFEMGIAVSLRAPDCKTSFSSIGSSGTGLAQGSGIAYSDASRPQEMDSLLTMQPATWLPEQPRHS